MQKPNVLFISSWYPSEEHATLGNFVQRHAEAIQPYVNLEVLTVVFTSKRDHLFIDFKVINGVNTTIVYYPKVASKLPLYSQWSKYKKYLTAFKLGYNAIKKRTGIQKFDLNHTNVCYKAGLFSLYLKKKENLPYVLTEHWTIFLPYRNEFNQFSLPVKRMIKKIISNAEMLLPVSEHLATSMANLGLKNNYQVIPNVADVTLFTLRNEKSEGENFKFLHISTLDDNQKNITGIFKALKQLAEKRNDFKLVIVTDGDIEEGKKVQTRVGLSGDLVEYHGTKTPNEIAEFYKQANCFLMFSQYENLPCVIVESMSAGLPVISTNIAGIPEHVDASKGILVKPNQLDELVDAMNKMIEEYHHFKKEEIRDYAIKHFSNEAVGKQFLEVYQKIIARVS